MRMTKNTTFAEWAFLTLNATWTKPVLLLRLQCKYYSNTSELLQLARPHLLLLPMHWYFPARYPSHLIQATIKQNKAKLQWSRAILFPLSGRDSIFFFWRIYYLFIYLFIEFLAALGLHCCARGFLSCSERGLLFVAMRGLLWLWSTGSRCAGFSSCGSRALEHRLSSCGAQA